MSDGLDGAQPSVSRIVRAGQEMSRQRDMLPEVVDTIRQRFPGSPLYLGGSVSLGNEIPESDIDLVIIVPDVGAASFPGGETEHESADFKLVRAFYRGVPLHLHFGTTGLLKMLEDKPWRAYKFLRVEVLHDPGHLAQRVKEKAALWFERHPDIADLQKKWLDEWTERNMSRGKRQGALIKEYPDVDAWWPYLDRLVAEGEPDHRPHDG